MEAAEKNLAFADALVAQLVACGAEHFVLSPGSRCTPLTLAAARCPGAKTWVNIDERGAAFFAQGIAKASGKPAVLICTSGTAAANYLPAIIEAAQSGMPLLVLTADRPASLYECGAPQTINQLGLYGSNVRWFLQCPVPGELSSPEQKARAIAVRAFARAAGEGAGPVHLNCPFDEPLVPGTLPEFSAHEDGIEFLGEPRAACARSAARLAGEASRATRGWIVAGPLPQEPQLRRGVLEFAARTGMPVLADAASGLRFGESFGARVFSHFDAWLRLAGELGFEAPDFVLGLGAQPTSKSLMQYLASCGAPQACFAAGGRWADSLSTASLVLGGLPDATLRAALARCEGGTDSLWCEELASFEAAAAAETAQRDSLASGAEIALARRMIAELSAGANLFLSNSMPIREIDWFGGARAEDIHVYVNRGANGIDGIVSSALGVLAATGRPTYLLTGDLALLHDLNALAFAGARGLPLQIVAVNNDGGGIFGYLPVSGEGALFEEFFRTPHGRSITDAAAALGVPCERAGELRNVSNWLANAGQAPRLLEVCVDAARSAAIHRAYWGAVRARVVAGGGEAARRAAG